MNIDYAITVCNELEEIKRLVGVLKAHKREEDNIIVQFDQGAGTEEVLAYLKSEGDNITLYLDNLDKNFGAFKNRLLDRSTADWHFQIDADEEPTEQLIKQLPDKLANTSANLVGVSRASIILCDNMEEFDRMNRICKFRPSAWVEDRGVLIGWPSGGCWRIVRKGSNVRWERELHESLQPTAGRELVFSNSDLSTALLHEKTMYRQLKQHWFYTDTMGQRIGTEHLRDELPLESFKK